MDPVSKIVEAARQALFSAVEIDKSKPLEGGAPIVPESVQNKMAAAVLKLVDANNTAALQDPGDDAPFAVNRVIARPPADSPGATIRTGPELIRDFTPEIRAARTKGEIRKGVRLALDRLGSTGVYRDVQSYLEKSSDPAGGVDLVFELDEARIALETGASQLSSGKIEAGTNARLFNYFGTGETLSAAWANRGEFSLSSFTDLTSLTTPTPTTTTSGAMSFADRAEAAISPSLTLSLNKPTFFGQLIPFTLGLRKEMEQHVWESGFTNHVTEVKTGIKDTTGKHGLTYSYTLRNIIPFKAPNSLFQAAVAPEVVAECGPNTKSSLIYTYLRDRLGGVTASRGTKTTLSLELAGLGGDASFWKVMSGWKGATSLVRYASDLGYAPAPTATEWAENKNSPRPDVAGATIPFFAETSGQPWSLTHQLAGWLCGGVTMIAEGQAGYIGSYPTTTTAAGGRKGGPSIVDRLFLGPNAVRGYDAVGPRGAVVTHGNPIGDMLGGDLLVSGSLRALLPPPIPSITLANAGLRTQVWGSGGIVGSASSLTSQPLETTLTSSASYAAGVGLVLPIGGAITLEGNYTLWHGGPASDARAKIKIQVMA